MTFRRPLLGRGRSSRSNVSISDMYWNERRLYAGWTMADQASAILRFDINKRIGAKNGRTNTTTDRSELVCVAARAIGARYEHGRLFTNVSDHVVRPMHVLYVMKKILFKFI